MVASTPLIAALVSRLVADATPRKTLSAVEDRLIAVLRDEFSRVRNTPLLLPMPRDSRLRVIAEGMFLQSHAAADLGKLASSAGMSRRNFTRRFKFETGISVGRWRQLARLVRGINMLIAGKTVTETAFALGYDSLSSFVLLCQRHTGMSPTMLARTLLLAGE